MRNHLHARFFPFDDSDLLVESVRPVALYIHNVSSPWCEKSAKRDKSSLARVGVELISVHASPLLTYGYWLDALVAVTTYASFLHSIGNVTLDIHESPLYYNRGRPTKQRLHYFIIPLELSIHTEYLNNFPYQRSMVFK